MAPIAARAASAGKYGARRRLAEKRLKGREALLLIDGGFRFFLEGEAAVAEKLDTGVDDAGVVADAPALAGLLQPLLEAEGRPVGAEGADGFDDVGHSQDLRLGKDGVADESLGIARAVQPLVVLEDDVGHGPGKGDIFDDLVADPGGGP